MEFYGVGVKFGGVDDMLPLFLEKDCWFMGYLDGEKPRLDKQIESVNEGDILFAKAYGATAQSHFLIRAIGIVASKDKPLNIPAEYKDRPGFSVIWIKYFEEPIRLSAGEYDRGGIHTSTIYHERNDKFKYAVKEMMKYDYLMNI